jgi:rhamnosyltransferase
MNISAIIVTYNPSPGFFDSLNDLKSQFDQLIIIDNASNPETYDLLRQTVQENKSNIEIIYNEINLGIATALNQGFALLLKQGYDFAFAFDQDSRPAPGMIGIIIDTFNFHPDREKIAIVAPTFEDPVAGITTSYLRPRGRILFERTRCAGQVLDDVSTVITSGAFYNLKAYQKIGPFRDDFFMDYVDTEYCLRLKQHGYNIVVACNGRLYHRVGNQQKKHFGPLTMHPTFHSPLRWYYISRNRIPMFQLYALRFPYWLLYELMVNSYGMVRLLLFEDQKINKLLAILLGTLDGLKRCMGPISNSRKALITRSD